MTYTAQYCEENIYLLAKSFYSEGRDHRQSYAVFISNLSRNVALFHQRASQAPQLPVVWDYHVVLLTAENHQASKDGLTLSVWDYDTRLEFPCPFDAYMIGTFPDLISDISASCGLDLVSHVRVVPTPDFLDYFASDRSHMVKAMNDSALPMYLAPPPSYPPIIGPKALEEGTKNNLFSKFLDMRLDDTNHQGASGVNPGAGEGYGRVMDVGTFRSLRWLSSTSMCC